ncbi:hypothetical protein WT83_22725 [Burkholderia territorii]|uniref:Uncharacterized protein n=1 Tax=Burkholderia territorii TaxID=1503055 RepID=A0A108ECB5_9BURK|nr:hypothetical protein WT83_22725 [Burkholderia territorii]
MGMNWVEFPLSDLCAIEARIICYRRHLEELVHRDMHQERSVSEVVANEDFHWLLRRIAVIDQVAQRR